jgi:hypothetical protein
MELIMTLDEARNHIDDGVVYKPAGGKPETGVITAVSSVYVFVQYAGERGTKATYPEDLTLLAQPAPDPDETDAAIARRLGLSSPYALGPLAGQCPGSTEYGHGLSLTSVHGCCCEAWNEAIRARDRARSAGEG